MSAISMFEAKTNLSKYVAEVETHQEPYVVILRNGKPVAKIVPYYQEKPLHRIGIAANKLPLMPSLEEFDDFHLEDELIGKGNL